MSLTIFKNTSLKASRTREAFVVPVSDNLLALHLLGGANAAEQAKFSARNYAPNVPSPAQASGTPNYSTDSVVFDSSSRLTHTQISEPKSCTVFWVGKVMEANLTSTDRDSHLIGWGGDGQGAMLHANTTNKYRFGGMIPNVSSFFVGPDINANHGVVQMIAGVIEDGIGMTIYNLTEGISETEAHADPRATGMGAEKLHLGGVYGGSTANVGGHETHIAAAWDKALSVSEVDAMAAWFRAVYADINDVAAIF